MRPVAGRVPGSAAVGVVPWLPQLAGRPAQQQNGWRIRVFQQRLAPCASSSSTLEKQQVNNSSTPVGLTERDAAPNGGSPAQHGAHDDAGLPEQPELRRGGYLQELYIRDFALVAEQRVRLQPGLTVITGESGAGKSVLVAALGQILGAPAPENCIRAPASTAVVEGRLLLSPAAASSMRGLLGELGVPQRALPAANGGPAELSLRREIVQGDKAGSVRSRSFINGAAVSQRVLREVGSALVDVNGQHAAQTLRDPGAQLALLDRLAGTSGAAAAFGAALARLRAAEGELRALQELGDEGLRGELQALVDQVAAAGLRPGEERQLRQRLRALEARRGSVQRCALAAAAVAQISQELRASVEGQLRPVLSQERTQAGDAEAEGAAEGEEGSESAGEGPAPVEAIEAALRRVAAARQHLAAAEREVESYASGVRLAEQEAAEASERLACVTRLLRSCRARSSEELLEAADKAGRDLDHWHSAQGSREQLEARVAAARASLAADAGALSQRRRAAAGKLRAAVEGCLGELAMAGCRFDVRIGWDEAGPGEGLAVPEAAAAAAGEAGGRAWRLRPEGLDRAEFLLAAGEAEPLRPLGAVASGGERARVMLALKAAPAAARLAPEAGAEGSGGLGDAGSAPVLVLDELDAGVGGRLGGPVGRLLARMAGGGSDQAPAQILCVSHLPQVAAAAQHHVCVRKAPAGEGARVTTRFEALEGRAERLAEIAAMGGVRREEASAMLAAAGSA